MTRKDFELIAEIIKERRLFYPATNTTTHYRTEDIAATQALNGVARDLANRLRATNPHFDAARFLKACGVNDG